MTNNLLSIVKVLIEQIFHNKKRKSAKTEYAIGGRRIFESLKKNECKQIDLMGIFRRATKNIELCLTYFH